MAKTYKGKPKSLRKRSAFRRKRVVKKTGRPTRALAKMVQSIISRNIENKAYQAAYQMPVQATQPDGAVSWFGLIPVSPYYDPGAPIGSIVRIEQGVEQAMRVGNTIRTKRCIFKGVMYPLPPNEGTNPDPCPMEVCMWIFKIKDQKNGAALTNAQYFVNNEFFQSSNSTTGVTGDIINMVQTINADNIKLYYKRVFKLGFASGATLTNDNPNNDFALNRKFSIDITKYLPKVIKYDDDNENPSINPVYCFIAPFRADGSVYDGNYKVINVDYELNYVYEDA